MVKVTEENLDEVLEHMEKYVGEIREMSVEDSRAALIRMGVLDSYGRPKEQICTEPINL